MTTTTAATRPGHAPGWSWRKPFAGLIDYPTPDAPTHVGGVCKSGWHNDCPQAPIADEPAPMGQCSCECHRRQPGLW